MEKNKVTIGNMENAEGLRSEKRKFVGWGCCQGEVATETTERAFTLREPVHTGR